MRAEEKNVVKNCNNEMDEANHGFLCLIESLSNKWSVEENSDWDGAFKTP